MRKTTLLIIGLLALVAQAPAQTEGTVVATMDAEGYTYAQLEVDGETVWFAAPAVEIKVGDPVVASAGMAMSAFHSKSLDRTFDTIYFVDSIAPATASKSEATLPAGHPPINAAPSRYDFSAIEKPEGSKTVAEIHQESATLAGQPVVVRGIAVKVTNGIMGKNWIHLQDGTGATDSNDLAITTTNAVETGTTITASGTLATNLDFGYGYTYAILLQDAVVIAE